MAARTRTLGELRADVLWQADREGATLRNAPGQVDRAINQSIAEFREAVSEAANPYYLVKSEGSLSSGPTSPYHFGVLNLSALSPAHLRIYGFDVKVSNTWLSLDPVQFRERNDVQSSLVGGSSIPRQFFEFDRGSIAYAPASDASYDYLLWYLPVHTDLVADGDSFDGINGFGDDWVVFNAVSRLLLRDRDAHLERFELERARLLARVLHVGRQRQRAGAHVRGGTRGSDRRGLGRDGFFSGGTAGDSLNQPGSGEGGRVALARSDGKIAWTPGEAPGDDLKWSGSGWERRRGFITVSADPTGATNADSALRAALAAARPGQCVFIPDGVYLINHATPIVIPAGVTLMGSERGHNSGCLTVGSTLSLGHMGTQLRVTGTGNLFQVSAQAAVRHLEIYYPNQNGASAETGHDVFSGTPVEYGWTFDCNGSQNPTIENVTALNPLDFIRVSSGTGCRINDIWAWPLRSGIHLGRVADIARISNVQFNRTTVLQVYDPALLTWVLANGVAFQVDGAELFQISDCFAFNYWRGLRFLDADADNFTSCMGSWTAGGLDTCGICVEVAEPNGLNLTGLAITNATLSSSGTCIHFKDTNASRSAAINAANVRFSGVCQRAVMLDTGSYSTFSLVNGYVYSNAQSAFHATDATSAIHLVNVGVPPGVGRRTGGAGKIIDIGPRVVS